MTRQADRAPSFFCWPDELASVNDDSYAWQPNAQELSMAKAKGSRGRLARFSVMGEHTIGRILTTRHSFEGKFQTDPLPND